MAKLFQVAIDCEDPAGLAAFWIEALEYRLQDPHEGLGNSSSMIVDPEGQGPQLYFQRVPEPKAGKTRVHLDINLSGRQDLASEEHKVLTNAIADRIVGLGATKVEEMGRSDNYWIVLRDPEGNEFCVQ